MKIHLYLLQMIIMNGIITTNQSWIQNTHIVDEETDLSKHFEYTFQSNENESVYPNAKQFYKQCCGYESLSWKWFPIRACIKHYNETYDHKDNKLNVELLGQNHIFICLQNKK